MFFFTGEVCFVLFLFNHYLVYSLNQLFHHCKIIYFDQYLKRQELVQFEVRKAGLKTKRTGILNRYGYLT